MITDRSMIGTLTQGRRFGFARLFERERSAPDPKILIEELVLTGRQGIIVLGPQLIEFCNDRAYELNGTPKSVMAPGKPWMDFFKFQMDRGDFGEGEAAERFFDDLIANFQERKVMQIERRAGDGRTIRSDRIPNSIGGMTLTLTDITELKLQQAEAKAASIVAQIAGEEKSKLLEELSRELRTPLNGILGMAEVLTGTDLTDEQRSAAEVILSSAEDLERVADDMLEGSKRDFNPSQVKDAPFDVLCTLRNLIADFTVACGGRLRLRLAREMPLVVGKVALLRRAVTLVVQSALDQGEDRYVDVKITYKQRTDDMGLVLIYVSDRDFESALNDKTAGKGAMSVPSPQPAAETDRNVRLATALTEMQGGTLIVTRQGTVARQFAFAIPVKMDGASQICGDLVGADKAEAAQ